MSLVKIIVPNNMPVHIKWLGKILSSGFRELFTWTRTHSPFHSEIEINIPIIAAKIRVKTKTWEENTIEIKRSSNIEMHDYPMHIWIERFYLPVRVHVCTIMHIYMCACGIYLSLYRSIHNTSYSVSASSYIYIYILQHEQDVTRGQFLRGV